MTTAKNIAMDKLEATSEFKKVSVSVKELAFTKATDIVGLQVNLAAGAMISVRNMRFVKAPSTSGDLNGDGFVDASDIQVVLNDMAADTNDPKCDLNGDGFIDASDIQVILNIMAAE